MDAINALLASLLLALAVIILTFLAMLVDMRL
jgi:hypothetical protein